MSQPQPPPPPPTPTPPLPTVQQQNLPNLATIVPSLTVAQLKQCVRDIRSQFGYCMTIGGNKPELVRKMLAYIAQNPTRLEAIRQVIQTNLGTPTWSLQNQSAVRPKPGYGTPSASSSPNNAAPSSLPNRPALSLTDWLKFRPSPFIEIINPLTSPMICNEVYGNRFLVKLDFFLNSVQTSLLEPFGSNGPSSSRVPHQLLFYCTTIPTSYHHYPPPAGGCLVEFPTMCEIKVNSKLLEVNLRGLRKRPGSVYPPNITPFCSKGIINKVDFTYQHTQQKFVVCVYFCRRKSIDEIVKEIKEKRYLSKELVLEKFQKKSKEKDDVVTTQSSLSLRDPIAFHRINVPCRSTFCTHAQCFDAKTFLSMNEQTPTWTCPLCNRELKSWDEVIVDGYFESILNSVSPDIDAVVLEPDYGWRLPNSSGNTHEKERSSDMRTIVNLDDDETITTPTTKKRPRSVSRSPPPAKRISMQNNFIDLTVESDEGEPIDAGPIVARSKDVGKDCASKTTHVTPVAEAVTPTAAATPAASTTPPPVLKNVSIQDNSTPTLSPPYPRLPLLPIHTEPSEASPSPIARQHHCLPYRQLHVQEWTGPTTPIDKLGTNLF